MPSTRRAVTSGWTRAAVAGLIGLAAVACSRAGYPARPGLQGPSAATSDRRSALPRIAAPRVAELGEPRPIRRGGGTYKVGRPYQIGGQWYFPKEEPQYDRIGIASWYGRDFHGKRTANGETFDMEALTGAHPTLPIPSYAYVTNLSNGRTLLVRINDRGPYKRGRLIDLSRRVSELLDFERSGTAHVRVRYAGPAPLDGNERQEMAYLHAQPWSRLVLAGPGSGAGWR